MPSVACLKCKQVVFAYDHTDFHSGHANMLSLPCPRCGAVRNYDGHSGDWEAMKAGAKSAGWDWHPSGSNVWFDADQMTEYAKQERQYAPSPILRICLWTNQDFQQREQDLKTLGKWSDKIESERREKLHGKD
ncbi:MAG: hypothetical protein ACYSWU_17960 [Planctomycetota bacterium]|jgi:hypothetical protein